MTISARMRGFGRTSVKGRSLKEKSFNLHRRLMNKRPSSILIIEGLGARVGYNIIAYLKKRWLDGLLHSSSKPFKEVRRS